MKKLLLLTALIISFSSFGQEADFDFNDIKNMSSLKLFKKFCFEEGFTKVRDSDNYTAKYAYGYNSKEEGALIWATYYIFSKTFHFQFSKWTNGSSDKSFEAVLNQVKKQCKFYDFKDDLGDEYIYYTCPNSSFKGKIGFRRGEKEDFIMTFDF